MIKSFLRFLAKKHQPTRKVYNFLFYWRRKLNYYFKFYRTPINKKTVIFESFMGKSYGDSPKAIYLEMIQNPKYHDFTFVWSFNEPLYFNKEDSLNKAILVKRNSDQYSYYLAKSKYWISNSRANYYLTKKLDQVYLQTWHGTPFKKIGFDIEKGDNANHSFKELRKKYKIESNLFNYIISPSKFCSEKLSSAFDIENPNEKILEVGYPRNDFLRNYQKNDVETIKKRLGISNNKKVVLYAPTWRDNQHIRGVGYTFTPPLDFKFLQNSLGEGYVLLVRFHYFIKNSIDLTEFEGFVIDTCDYPDINDLYIISDLFITDYSSAFFDFAILDRPIIFFMYDLNTYTENLRDFYFDIKELPGTIVQEANLLPELIQEFTTSTDKYAEKRQQFVQKFNYLDDGNAAKRVVEKIFDKTH